MAPLKIKKGPPEMTYGSQIYHGSPKVLRGTQGEMSVVVCCVYGMIHVHTSLKHSLV